MTPRQDENRPDSFPAVETSDGKMALDTAAPGARGLRWKRAGIILGLAVVVGLAIWFVVRFNLLTQIQDPLQELLQSLGFWKYAVFIVLYIIACVLLLPGSFLTLAAGAVFGLMTGSILVNIGATLGSAAAFLVGRYLARDWVAQKISGHPNFIAIDKAVADEGWKIVLLTRLCPIFPYFLLNYAYGLTRVSFRHYFFATWIGIVPGSTLFVYIGSLANPGDAKDSIWTWAFKILGLIATLLLTVYITKVARRALSQKISVTPTGGPAPTATPSND